MKSFLLLLCGFRTTVLLHFPASAKGDLYTVLLKWKNGCKHPQSTFIVTVSFQIKFRAKTAKTYDYSNTPLYSGWKSASFISDCDTDECAREVHLWHCCLEKKTNINMRSVIDISYISLIPDSPTLNDKTIKTIMAVLHYCQSTAH